MQLSCGRLSPFPSSIRYLGASEMNTGEMDWIMQKLISHPDKMAGVKEELKSVMGDEKVVDDSKMSKLPYLRAVVKEVMRLWLSAKQRATKW